MLANCLLFTFGIAIPKLPNAWEFGSNLAGDSDPTQLPPPGGPTVCPEGETAPGQENSSGHQGPAGRPIDRPRLRWKSGTYIGNRAFRGPQTAPPAFCNPGLRDPWQAGLCYHNPMLAETKTRRRISSRPPRRSHANPQSSAHLQLPSLCLAVAAVPPPGGPTACPEGDAVHRPRSAKAAPRSQQNGPGTGPSSGSTWDPAEKHGTQRAADSPATGKRNLRDCREYPANPQSSALL